MGFAASQARLILLTARKSDLEFRAQQITNAEMMLAMRSEEVANKYSRAISNQTVKIIDGNQEHPVTASWLNALGYTVKKVTKDGLEDWDMPAAGEENKVYNHVFSEEKLNQLVEDGVYTADQAEAIKSAAMRNISSNAWTTRGGAFITIDTVSIDISDCYTEVEDVKASLSQGDVIGQELLDGVNRGQLVVLDASGNEVSLHNGTGFVISYDTSDDEEADATYRRETAAIQVKEKRLQMEMKQIEAQQKACENEIESAKKLQDKNADSMFKYMS